MSPRTRTTPETPTPGAVRGEFTTPEIPGPEGTTTLKRTLTVSARASMNPVMPRLVTKSFSLLGLYITAGFFFSARGIEATKPVVLRRIYTLTIKRNSVPIWEQRHEETTETTGLGGEAPAGHEEGQDHPLFADDLQNALDIGPTDRLFLEITAELRATGGPVAEMELAKPTGGIMVNAGSARYEI